MGSWIKRATQAVAGKEESWIRISHSFLGGVEPLVDVGQVVLVCWVVSSVSAVSTRVVKWWGVTGQRCKQEAVSYRQLVRRN